MSLSFKFCHGNVCGFRRQIVFTNDRLPTILQLYAYLKLTKVVHDNLNTCQIC